MLKSTRVQRLLELGHGRSSQHDLVSCSAMEEAIKWKESNRVKEGLQEGSKKRSEDETVDLTSKLEVSDKRQSP